jgi:hypothetical protein
MLIAAWTRNPGTHFDLPPSMFWLIWVGFIGFFVLIVWAAARAKRKRREALEQFALESGFSFSAEADTTIAEELAPIQLSMVAASRVRYENVLRGSRGGREVVIADRIAGQGKSQSVSTIVATRFETPLPRFYLCAENFLLHIAEKLGYCDIDLDYAPEFSQRFFLHSDQPDEVKALFTTDVTSVFEQLPTDSTLSVQSGGQWVAVYRASRLASPEQLREMVDSAGRIADALHRGQEASAKWK